MYHEGTNLAQNVKESSSSGARLEGTAGFGFSSNSAKPIAENITTSSKLASPEISLLQVVQGIHDGPNSLGKAMPVTIGASGMTGSSSGSRSIKLVGEKSSGGSKPTSLVMVHAGEKKVGWKNSSNPLGSHLSENYNGELKLASVRERNDDLTESEGGGDDAIGDSDDVVGSKSIRSLPNKGVQDEVKDAATHTINSGRSSGGISSDKRKGVVNDSELHIWTERERRKKMKNMYDTLHSLLPQLPDKADQVSIVEKAIECIKTLECTVERMEKLKVERLRAQQLNVDCSAAPAPPPMRQGTTTTLTRESTMMDMVQNKNAQQTMVRSSTGPLLGPIQSWCSPNIALSITGNDGFIILYMPRQQGVLTKALYILEQCHIDVLTTSISSDANWTMLHIHGRINAASAHLLGNMTTEDSYKLAVSTMLQCFIK